MKPLLSVCAFALSGLIMSSTTFASVQYLTNIESDNLGSLPASWSASGSAVIGVGNDVNHTGMPQPWPTPDFGPSGSQSLAMNLGPGSQNATLAYNKYCAACTDAFTFNWSFRYSQGMTGLLLMKFFAGNAEGDLNEVGTIGVDLATGHKTSALSAGYEHMLFTGFSANVVLADESAGGHIYFDDISLEDTYDPAWLSLPQGMLWPSEADVWEEAMFASINQGDTAYRLVCDHKSNITDWTHVPEPSSPALLSLGVLGLVLAKQRSKIDPRSLT